MSEKIRDMLVKLYELDEYIEKNTYRDDEVVIRNAMPFERHFVCQWAKENFAEYWESECASAFGKTPVTCLIAVRNKEILGFICYDTTFKGFLGPIGVKESYRGNGLGKKLLLEGLIAMRNMGYPYAIIGRTKLLKYYEKICGAKEIPDSFPGPYKGML